MHDAVAITIQRANTQEMLVYTQQIEMLANAIDAEREHIALFLEHHPEMEEFLSGDLQNGYTYVPAKIRVAPEELLKSMEPIANGRICIPIEAGHDS